MKNVLFENCKIKYKFLTLDELIICLDRLSRFKLPEESFYRVFSSILTKCMISPSFSKKDISSFDSSIITNFVTEIWNSSVKSIFNLSNDYSENFNLLKFLNEFSFYDFDENTKNFINSKLLIYPILKSIDIKKAPKNLVFLYHSISLYDENKILSNSVNNSLLYPIRKLIIVEGITEEILLPVFAKKMGFDFEKLGIYILGAGGKSKSPSLYLKLKYKLKISVTLLFDSDANEIAEMLRKNLLQKDDIYVIKKGEFEDIISINLIKRTLNSEYQPATLLTVEELRSSHKMTENIENFYRSRHLGEFKKSKLAKLIAINLKYDSDVSEDIKNLILKLVNN